MIKPAPARIARATLIAVAATSNNANDPTLKGSGQFDPLNGKL